MTTNDATDLVENIEALVSLIGIPTIVVNGPDMFGDYNLTPAGETAALGAVVSNLRDPDVVKASAILIALLWHHAPTFVRLRDRVSELERACVEAVIPLEAMTISGATTGMSIELRQGIQDGIKAVRNVLSSKEQNDDR